MAKILGHFVKRIWWCLHLIRSDLWFWLDLLGRFMIELFANYKKRKVNPIPPILCLIMIQRTTGLFVYWIPIQQLDCLHPHTKSTISSIRLRTYLGRYYFLADHKHLCWTWWSSHCHRTTLTLRKHSETSSKCLTVVHTWMNDNGISRLCWRKYFVNIARQGTDTFDPLLSDRDSLQTPL